MLRDHGAMEIEIKRIDGTGGGEPLQQLAGDALIGLAASTRPEGVAEHQSSGTSSWCCRLAAAMNPAVGRLIPSTASNSVSPAQERPGQPSAWTKS